MVGTVVVVKIYLLKSVFQKVNMPLHCNQVREFALLAWENRTHYHLVNVGYFLKEHQKFDEVNPNRFLTS